MARRFSAKALKGSRIQEPKAQIGEVNVTFKEPVHRIVDRIKNKPYFQWPNKMGGQPVKEEPELVQYLPHGLGAYHRTMSGIKGSFKAVGESMISERVCGRHRKSRYRAGYPAKGEPSPTPIRNN